MSDANILDKCLRFVNTSGMYWLNSALIMTNTGDTGLAVVGANTTKVTISCDSNQAGGSNCPTQDQNGASTLAVFELFLSKAAMSLSLSTSDTLPGFGGFSPQRIGGTGSTIGNGLITAGGSVDSIVGWTSQSTNSAAPNFVDPANAPANHKCIVARCFTDPNNARDSANDALAVHTADGDPHYAQHNLSVQPVKGTGHIKILNGNPREEAQMLVMQAVPDLEPTRGALAAILPSLEATPGFKRISNKPLDRVSFDLDHLTEKNGEGFFDKIEDFFEREAKELVRHLEDIFHKATPHGGGTQGKVKIPPNFYAPFDFVVDTSGATPGDAFIYHLTQTTAPQGKPFGGITVAVIAT